MPPAGPPTSEQADYGGVSVRAGRLKAIDVAVSGKAKPSDRLTFVLEQAALSSTLEPAWLQEGETGFIIAFESGDASNLHWRALEQARSFYRDGGRHLVFIGLANSWSGGLPALARTAAREWPNTRIQSISLETEVSVPDRLAQRIVDAISSSAPDVTISKNGDLYMPDLGPLLTHHQGQPPTAAAGVWLVTGGARGVTADCVIELASRTGGQFALIGRSALTPWPDGVNPDLGLKDLRGVLAQQSVRTSSRQTLPEIDRAAKAAIASREIGETLAKVSAAGAEAAYYPCDLTHADVVASTIAQIISRQGQINGLVHGAGVLADRAIMDKTRNEFDRVFGTKVTGLRHVLDALNMQQLTHVGLFSSAAARFGNPGQADYAMANEVLNSIARRLQQSHAHIQVKSFNWGPWAGGMVDDTLARHFEKQGIGLIPRGAGARIFADQMLNGDTDTSELLIGDTWAS